MAAQKGRDLLIKIDAGGGAFETAAGLRATRIAFEAAAVDVTTAESAERWRELLGGAGARSASISGAGVFKDAASDALVRAAFFAGATPRVQVVIPDFGTVEGPFLVAKLDYAGEHDGEAAYSMSFESAGALSFTAL